MTSLFSGTVLRSALIVPENIDGTLSNIANKPGLMRAYILVDLLTTLGILFLGPPSI